MVSHFQVILFGVLTLILRPFNAWSELDQPKESFKTFKINKVKLKGLFNKDRLVDLESQTANELIEFQKSNRPLKKKSMLGLFKSTIDEKVDPPIMPEIPDEESYIYRKVLSEIGQSYNLIGQERSSNITQYNENFNLGSSNFSGFNWQKPMGYFGVFVNRQIAPDLMSDKYIVTDTFTLNVDAFTFLSNLREEGAIEMSDIQLGAYAGISFKREYRYAHMANSFKEGLTSEFNKLFLSFLMFRGDRFSKIVANEYLKKEDYFGVKAGGVVSVPPVYNVTATAGAFGEYKRLSSISLHGVNEKEQAFPGEWLRLSFEKSSSKTLGIHVGIHADFYELLRLTLFQYDYSYEFEEKNTVNLSFHENDKIHFKEKDDVYSEVKNLLRLKKADTENILRPFVNTTEKRIKEVASKEYQWLLFWGKQQQNKTEEITIADDKKKRTFFRSHFETLSYSKSFFSALMGNLLKYIFRDATNTLRFKHKNLDNKKLSFEYEYKTNLKAPVKVEERKIENEKKISLIMSREYSTLRTHKKWDYKSKKKAIRMIRNFSTLDQMVGKAVEENFLRGPMTITSNMRVNEKGMKFFNGLSYFKARKYIKRVCRYSKRTKGGIFGWFSFVRKRKIRKCYRRFMRKYEKYKDEYWLAGKIHLWKFKDVINHIHKHGNDKFLVSSFFGRKNVFFNGKFSSITQDDQIFQTFFSDGEFNHHGVIEKYKKQMGNQRAPASDN